MKKSQLQEAFPSLSDEETDELVHLIFFSDTPDSADAVLDYANKVLNGHGVEAVQLEDYQVDNYYYNIVLLYVNMGDTYDTTLCYDTEKGEFLIGSWGDWLEEWELRRKEKAMKIESDEQGNLIAYKAVRKLPSGTLKSLVMSKYGRYAVKYILEKPSVPPHCCGPLSAFNSLENLFHFLLFSLGEPFYDIKILTCHVVKDPKNTSLFSPLNVLQHPPYGTVFCKQITPIKDITEEAFSSPHNPYHSSPRYNPFLTKEENHEKSL